LPLGIVLLGIVLGSGGPETRESKPALHTLHTHIRHTPTAPTGSSHLAA
jgi:hypothetical protein